MPTFREVKVRIESRIDELDEAGLTLGEPERAQTHAEGYFRFGDGGATLTYAEESEGGRISSELEISGDVITVRRTGAIESELRFAEGCEHSSLYSVPPYKFDVTVRARRVRHTLSDMGGQIDVLYNMSIGGAHKAVRMKIWIQAS